MRSFYLPSGRPVRLGSQLGEGRQGLVFAVDGTEIFCAKIYLEPSAELTRRCESLVQAPQRRWPGDGPDHLHMAWPQSTLKDENGALRGILMPYIPGVVLADLLAGQRADALEEPGWRTSLAVAGRLARVVGMAHDSGIVLGDLSPRNVIIDRLGRVTLIDCDTVQFDDSVTGRRLHAEHFTPEYLPPEAFPKPPVPLPVSHDRFGLGILICQVLMDGDHPYEGIPAGSRESSGIDENIRFGRNRLTAPASLAPTPGMLPPMLLPEEVRRLAVRCFGEGATDPSKRPAAAEWASALGRAGFGLMGCRRDAQHAYPVALPSCPWCARSEAMLAAVSSARPARSVPRPRSSGAAPAPARPQVQVRPTPAPQTSGPAKTGSSGKKFAVTLVILVVLFILIVLANN